MEAIQLNGRLSDQEMAKLNMQVDSFNKSLVVEGRKTQHELGKDDFLKLLITQLSNQDPTSPMENTEFIAQMAQFSSLEQMTNMSHEFAKMSSMMVSSQAVGTLGRTVQVAGADGFVTGIVEAVSYGENPQVVVNGAAYDMKQISTVYGD